MADWLEIPVFIAFVVYAGIFTWYFCRKWPDE